MTVNTINIVGQVMPPTGVPDTSSRVFFVMTGYDTDADDDAVIYPVPGKDDEDGFPIAADGTIDVDLWPNQEGERNTLYRVEVQVHQLNRPVRVPIASISVPNTGGPYNLNDLLGVEPPPDATVEEYIAQLAAAAAEAAAAADSAAADAASASGDADDAALSAIAAANSAASINPTNFLAKADNLAGLANTGTARTNLGLGTAATSATGDFATAAQGTKADAALPAASKATQPEAEAGTDNDKYMTALRTAQAIAAQAGVIEKYTSSAFTATAAGLVTVSHGMSGPPRFIAFRGKCLVADAGYAVDDEILLSINQSNSVQSKDSTPVITDTQISVRLTNNATAFNASNKTTGVTNGLTNTSWEYYIEALR